ncbi:MAG: 2,3-bisphosphoglycerate-independent phosphoglycerate mutase [Crocinitomicaceae bacterium]|nr:2,3-bisphosphoglycerate-independent phosphoglycerate mutase [Crocinitomicaceae bacterium]
MSKKAALLILDGWGIGKKDHSDAIYNANTPNMDRLMTEYPNATLLTMGEHVGLPKGQMGNSEVGHMNIGAGRIVYQELSRINNSIETGEFFQKEALLDLIKHSEEKGSDVHLMGLIGEGGVHAAQNHIYALIDFFEKHSSRPFFIHGFTDGRDTDPHSAKKFVADLETKLKVTKGKIASLIGRYYAMDRDKRWERIKMAYDLLTHGIGEDFLSTSEAIEHFYNEGITDEFFTAAVIGNGAKIKSGDAVLCFNFRTDRCRQITEVLTQKDHLENEMKTLELHYTTMTNYDENFKGVHVVFDKDSLQNTLGEVIESQGRKQIRIAETEKYAHVTFFFSGGREEEFKGEKRILINSPKVATYDLQPEMSAFEVRDAILNEINAQSADFICLNWANADMVGHTGVYEAIVKACEAVDQCLGEVVQACQENGYSVVVIADHGNSDNAVNPDGSPNTAHSLNPVPLVVIDPEVSQVKDGILADVAPSILKLMDIPIPSEFTGKVLV